MAERPDDLAAELHALGDWLDVPPPPDVRLAVRTRVAAAANGGRRFRAVRVRRRWSPRWVAAAAAVVLVLAVLVLPQGRAAVAHAVDGVLRFAGVEVHRTPHGQPSLPPSPSPLPSIRSAALDDARRAARFPVGVPTSLGVPEEVQLADPGPDGAPRVVSLLYRGATLRMDEFDGRVDLGFVKQLPEPGMEMVDVGGEFAIWLPVAHVIEYVDRDGVRHQETARLSGPTLVWQRGDVSYRLEGAGSRDEALAIARSVG